MSYWKEDRPHTIKEFLALLDNKVVKPKPKKRRWWVWTLLLLFIVVLLMSIKDLFSNGDNSKEVATKEKTVYMPTNVTAPAPDESEPVDAEEGCPDATYAEFAEDECPELEPKIDELKAPNQEEPEEVASAEASAEATKPATTEESENYATYKIGDYYNKNGKEGVVFEVWDGGRHGKIVSLNQTLAPWDSRDRWDDNKKKYINGTETVANSESDGKANTDKIMNRSDSEYFEAFVWCRKKGDDWYLPAVKELETISNNKSAINSTLAEHGGTELILYWSSTEYAENAEFCAWLVGMDDVYTGYGNKSNDFFVRAVSVF
jgi:hypothetical protein